MKKVNKIKSLSVILTLVLVVMLAIPKMSMAADQSAIELGTTSQFAVLAGSTITNTGQTTISGSAGQKIGLHPGTALTNTGSLSVSQAVYLHLADAVALQAKNDLVIAYDQINGLESISIPAELGGKTLTPGTYHSESGSFQITGNLILDAKGDLDALFIFKADSTLTTLSGSKVELINNATSCNTFWKVGSSATLGTNSEFAGHIFAMESITATTGAEIRGQLLARTGAVTLDTNTIRNGICPVAEEETSTTVETEEETTTTETEEETTTTEIEEETTTTETEEETTETEEETTTTETEEETTETEEETTETEEETTTETETSTTTETETETSTTVTVEAVTSTSISTPESTPTPKEVDVPIIPQTGQENDYTMSIALGSIAILLAAAGVVVLLNKSKKSSV